MNNTNGTLTNPRTWGQIAAAIPITIALTILIGIQIWLNHEAGKEERALEREFNRDLGKLFKEMANAETRTADAIEQDVQNDVERIAVRREQIQVLREHTSALNNLLREIKEKPPCED